MGRGTLYLMVASAVFGLASYIIHFGLGRYLGPVDYGIFGVVLSLVTTVNLLITSGIPQSAAKYIAEDSSKVWSIIRDANRSQMVFCLLLLALYLGLAGVIAYLLNDSSLIPYIRISALAIPAYAFHANYNAGYLNGLRKFGKQAISITGVSLARVAATFLLVLIGLGINGAIIGYAISALVGLLLAWRFLGPVKKSGVGFGWTKLVKFGIPAMAVGVGFYLLMSVDLLAVKALGSSEAEVGYYTAAATMSKLPYFLFSGLAVTLMPSISKSTAANNIELTRRYIRESMRYMFMLLLPAVVLISATAGDLLTLVYSSRYIEAAAPLSILVFGLAMLSVFLVLANIIMGSGRPGIIMVLALPLVGIDIGVNILLVPRYGLAGAAWATTIIALLGMSATAIYVFWRFRTLVAPKSLGRICLASVVIYLIALQVSLPAIWLPLIYIGLLTLYGGLLWLMRELNREDWRTFEKLVSLERFTSHADLNP